MASKALFPDAIGLVEAWLDGPGTRCSRRLKTVETGHVAAWQILAGPPILKGKPARLCLPTEFPAVPAEIYVDRSLCLVLPHVEESGRVCLGVPPYPGDYGDPCGAVDRLLAAFDDAFLGPCHDPEWVTAQFHAEARSYWTRFCTLHRMAPNPRPVANAVYVDCEKVAAPCAGKALTYFVANGKAKLPHVHIATGEGADPEGHATRHGWDSATRVKGRALFVELGESQRWIPSAWPRTLAELQKLALVSSGRSPIVERWFAELPRRAAATPKLKRGYDVRREAYPVRTELPQLVIFVQAGTPYCYQIFPPIVPRVQMHAIEPLLAHRVDASWSLSRDQEVTTRRQRQSRRVAILGCGSLGSPVAELLARAGVGSIELVDFESFDSDNSSRHLLGLSSLRRGKADALADRLKKEVPAVSVTPRAKTVVSWLASNRNPGEFDLVVDCTGESTVRVLVSRLRTEMLGTCPVVHAWLEPHCSAAHAVFAPSQEPWPDDDPADRCVNAATFSSSAKIDLPACGAGFHPYGAADAWQAAGFVAERVLRVLDCAPTEAVVWSWGRARRYIEGLKGLVDVRAWVPSSDPSGEGWMLARPLHDVLR